MKIPDWRRRPHPVVTSGDDIMQGDKMQTGKQQMLTIEEEVALFDDIKLGGRVADRARATLAARYRPLVLKKARDFARRTGMPAEDMIQEATIALLMAIDKFSPDRNARLGTLASYHIHSALVRYLMDNVGPTRVGTNVKDKRVFFNLRRLVADYEARTCRPIDDAGYNEIAESLCVPVEAVTRMQKRVFSHDVSIDATVQGDDGSVQTSWVEGKIGDDKSAPTISANLDQRRMMEEIRAILPSIESGRNLEILERRISGFDGPEEYRSLGEMYDISGERVRQIQRNGLRLLREALMSRGYNGLADISMSEG